MLRFFSALVSGLIKCLSICYRTMSFDTPNLNLIEDNFYDENEDMEQEDTDEDHEVHEDDPMPLESGSSEKGTSSGSSSRRRAKCWKNFTPGKKHSDGKTDVTCNHCHKYYCLNLRQNGTNHESSYEDFLKNSG